MPLLLVAQNSITEIRGFFVKQFSLLRALENN
jgi:hypothetical protein